MKNNIGNKRECCQFIKKGLIKVNDEIIVDCFYPVKEDDQVYFGERKLNASPLVYFMFNKPSGYISANKDKNPCVLDFFEQKDLSILGRLDKDTTGLMLLTNDKSLVKKITLPKNHLPKKYYVELKNKINDTYIESFKKGVIIDKDVLCRSAIFENIDEYLCYLTIVEGKYHQVKKMFLSLGNEVLSLKRVKIGEIELDRNLKEGEYRKLTKEELFSIKKNV